MDDQDHQCLRFIECRASVRDGYLDALLTLGDVALEELALCSPPEQAHHQLVRVSPQPRRDPRPRGEPIGSPVEMKG